MPRRSELVTNVALLVASLTLTLLVGEVAARYRLEAWPFDRPVEYPAYLTPEEHVLRWRFSPAEHRNSLGLRNREVEAKPAGTVRVLFLGDSMIWTGETSSGDLYTEVLERRLNEQLPSGSPRIEIVNAGVPGYTTYQELEFLRIHGLAMEPDLVVLGFVFNDLHDPYLHRPTTGKLLDMEPAALLRYFDTRRLPGALASRSYLAHLVAEKSQRARDRITGRTPYPFELRRDFFLAWTEYGWGPVGDRLKEVQGLLEARGVALHMIVFPVSDQVNPRYLARDEPYVLYPQTRIREIAETLHIPTLDLTDALRANGDTTLYKDYLHLNALGNDVVARALEPYLVDVLALGSRSQAGTNMVADRGRRSLP